MYGESLRRFQGHEYRDWAARRSKLAAYVERGGKSFAEPDGHEFVLYLGAASGTTVSHLSDLLPTGRIVAVEFSPRPFRELLHLASARPNIVPVLGDARKPEAYGAFVERPVDLLVQDIAQRDQSQIFARNLERFADAKTLALLAVKSRSVNVASPPRKVYEAVRKDLAAKGHAVEETVELEPFEKDHAVLTVRR